MNDDLRDLIRTIADYPKPGISFRDVTTLFGDPAGLARTIELLALAVGDAMPTKVAGIEARGFVLAGAVAVRVGAGFVPVRKKGKLPHTVIGRDYDLEYGSDRVEIHTDAVAPGEKVVVIDDLVATGGTALAAIELLEQAGAVVVCAAFIVDLPDLGGRQRIEARGTMTRALLSFGGH